MENLSTKDPRIILKLCIDKFEKGKGEDYLFYCSLALTNNKKPKFVFECLKKLFKKQF